MISENALLLTTQFYEWEILGRGWLLSSEPIDLEPTFTPFFGHYLPRLPIVDDGIRHTLVSRVISFFSQKETAEIENALPEVSYDLYPFENSGSLVSLQLSIPKSVRANIKDSEQLLTMLAYCTVPISFEIIGTSTNIKIQFVCRNSDVAYVKSQLKTLLIDVSIIEAAIPTTLSLSNRPFVSVDFGLQQEFMRPINQEAQTLDSLTGIFSVLEHLQEGQKVIFQVLFNGIVNHWKPSILRSVSNDNGDAFFADAPDMFPLAKEKIRYTFLAVTIRLLSEAGTTDDAYELARRLAFALISSSTSNCNALFALSDDEYTNEMRRQDILLRQSHRAGMLLNTKELSTFVHVPSASLISNKVVLDLRKTKKAPPITEGHTFTLGINIHNGIEKNVTISEDMRCKHTHIIGATGTGKSTLMLHMICQDIQHGNGITVIEPYGDLIDAVLEHIPASRIQDVVFIDPSDIEFPIGFNILKAHSDIEKEVLSSDLVASFRKLSTSWGDQMNSVFGNAILAFLESTKIGTLVDMRRFLIEKEYREEFLKSVSDPSISYYWRKEYPLLKTSSIGSILTRLDSFLRPKVIRNMVAQPTGIDFEQILQQKKILLVKLSQGLIGTENSYLLGSFIVSKIHQATLARQSVHDRSNFFVYIDEFQHFITPSLSHILSGARKYRLGLILAHQDTQQLQRNDSELLHTLFANASTRICFRLGETDAKRMSEGLSSFDATDIQNLNTGEAIVRIERPDYDFSLFTKQADVAPEIGNTKSVIIHSRNTYGTPKSVVEEMLKTNMRGFEIAVKEPEVRSESPIQTPSPPEPKTSALPEANTNIQPAAKKKRKEPAASENDEESSHRYLQILIKKTAESKGYKAVIEMPTADGKGSVDIHIEGNNLRLACEVSVTTDVTWELHNITKCLASNYDIVFVCSTEKKFNASLQKKVKSSFEETLQKKILVGEPEGLLDFLEEKVVKPTSSETTYKGYRIKVDYSDISDEAMKNKKKSISKIISDAMRKLKKGK